MTTPTNKEIYQAMVELEDKIERSFTSVAKAMEMIGEMVDVFVKRVDELEKELTDLKSQLTPEQEKTDESQ